MKKIFSFTIIAIVALLGVVATSCNKSNPVDKYIDLIDELTSKMNKISSVEELANFNPDEFNVKETAIISADGNYSLTESDKEKLTRAISDYLYVSFCKGFDLTVSSMEGADTDLFEEMKNGAKMKLETIVSNQIDNCSTLKDVNNAMLSIGDEFNESLGI